MMFYLIKMYNRRLFVGIQIQNSLYCDKPTCNSISHGKFIQKFG